MFQRLRRGVRSQRVRVELNRGGIPQANEFRDMLTAGRGLANIAYGTAFRNRVIKAVVEDRFSEIEAARIFRVGVASAIRWVEVFDTPKRISALSTGGDRRVGLKPQRLRRRLPRR